MLKKIIIKFRKSRYTIHIMRLIIIMVGKLPVKRNLIIFESFLGKQYSDSPRAIYEYLLKENQNYKMYWSLKDTKNSKILYQQNIKVLKRFSLRWLVLMARANYWVTNSRLPQWLPKPKHTIYLQTWHGTPLKKLAADMDEVFMPGTNSERYKRNFLAEAKKWDYLVSPNEYSTKIFERAFNFKQEIIESGYPRNDFLINFNNEKSMYRIKKSLNIPQNKKVILYAPTWRDNQYYDIGSYKFEVQMDLKHLQEELGEDYVIILRLHYLVAEKLDLTEYYGFAIDLSKHHDIRELYLIADLLITDYSSVFFDYANLKRPIIFYVYDLEEYRDNLRGFYFDLELNAPGPLVKTTSDIVKEIKQLDKNKFKTPRELDLFYKRYCYLEDGNATNRVVRRVFGDKS